MKKAIKMKKVCFLSSTFKNNECFDLNSPHNRDNCNYCFFDLKRAFQRIGFDLSTQDINTCLESEISIQLGMDLNCCPGNGKKYLILLESPHVDTRMFNQDLHSSFDKIFTWNDRLVDNQKYFKINYSFQFPEKISKKWDKKLCCMIAGNKTSKHPMELYSERIRTIEWFEKNRPDDFDLYGTQWDEFYFGRSIFGRAFNKLSGFRKTKFSSYRGKVSSKVETLQKYRFSICYENIKGQKGYITEKLFDCFFAGCVPIYWGAENVLDHIPKECFIDRRNFNNHEEMYLFIKDMDRESYYEYLNAIEIFLSSVRSRQFRAENFSDVILREVFDSQKNTLIEK